MSSLPSPREPHPSPPPLLDLSLPPKIHTYHCLCSTLLLASPYALTALPLRAHPAKDAARILPLPEFRSSSFSPVLNTGAAAAATAPTIATTTTEEPAATKAGKSYPGVDDEKQHPAAAAVVVASGEEEGAGPSTYWPSLLAPSLRLARKCVVVRREDGFEKRRVWRCARCGVGVGYEVEGVGVGMEVGTGTGSGAKGGGSGSGGRVLFLLEGGLVETGKWDGDWDG